MTSRGFSFLAVLLPLCVGAQPVEDWALQPLRAPAPPAIAETDWVRNDIDRFVLARLQTRGLRPNREADRAVLIRRLNFDLIGLPPSPAEVDAFVQDDQPRAYERLVDRLLASPHYGERWARHWLDVARYTESQGFEYDRLRDNAWHYRDYVINAFNNDKPYDQFVREQIAGDVIPPVTSETIIATSLLVCGPYDQAGNSQQNQTQRMITREEEMDDLVSVVSQSFLGMTVNCARCHTHKYDPIPQEDYYRVKAVFDGVVHGERDVLSDAEKAAWSAKAERRGRKISALEEQLNALRDTARARIAPEDQRPSGPEPYARWTFEESGDDLVGSMNGTLHGGARISGGRLHLNGDGQFLQTSPLADNIGEKTLAAWATVATHEQGGGGIISLENGTGKVFDAIVYAERQPRKWMAGSDGFSRTLDLAAPEETASPGQLIHMAIVYGGDKSVTVYRNGERYAAPYAANSLMEFEKGDAHVLIGRRHSGGGKAFFTGEIEDAALYNRALTAEEILALSAGPGWSISREQLLAALSETERSRYDGLRREIEALRQEVDQAPKSMKSYAGSRRQPAPTRKLVRGSVRQPAEEVAPRGLSAIQAPSPDFGLKPDAPEAERRRRFAEWVADPANPLTPRTMANRVWHYHFGRGIAATPNDLGQAGVPPTHPELLDWLASVFVEKKWSIKELHRLIVTSATYRQSSAPNTEAMKIDSENVWLWRFSPRRLEAEAVRDAMLAVSGQLNPALGGPSFRPFTMSNYGSTFYALQDRPEPEFNRRTIYRINVNSGKDPLLDAFDCPDPSVKAPRRMSTVTPLQALGMMNNAFVQRQAKFLAERALLEARHDLPEAIRAAYRYALGRFPTELELERARGVAGEHGMKELAWTLLNATEFLYVQ